MQVIITIQSLEDNKLIHLGFLSVLSCRKVFISSFAVVITEAKPTLSLSASLESPSVPTLASTHHVSSAPATFSSIPWEPETTTGKI